MEPTALPTARVDRAIFDRFPDYRACVVYATGIVNGPSDERSKRLLLASEEEACDRFASQPISQHPHVAAWRAAYSRLGSKPSRFHGSVEALLRRALKGGVPPINQLVDIYNAVSIAHILPAGGEERDTLDGILDNQTVLPIVEHTTDTHGYTEMIFGAYDLLGLRFGPRIRGLDRQRLYRHGAQPAVETAELLEHKIRPDLITPSWDELLRLAASLRHGWVPASLLLARLQAGSRRNPLGPTKASSSTRSGVRSSASRSSSTRSSPGTPSTPAASSTSSAAAAS